MNDKGTDIVFITSPDNWATNHPPFYYMSLAAWLEREGFSCEIIDEKVSWNPFLVMSEGLRRRTILQRVMDRIKILRPRYIGLAAFTSDYNTIMEMATQIKNRFGIPIVIGNAHATIAPQDFIFQGSPIDYVVIGEGEVTLTELLRALSANAEVSGVNGIAFLKEDRIHLTPKRALIQDLKVLPLPAYHKINMDYYIRPRLYLIRYVPVEGIGIYTGRGCPFQCEFCCSSLIWKSHDKVKFVRTIPIDQVLEELKFLKKEYDIDAFYILDDTFTLDKRRTLEFCRKLIESKLDLLWAFETRVNLIDEDMIRLAKEAGCIQIDFGVESGSQRLLDAIKKGITIEEIKRAFKICNENGVRTFATMLLNLPTETVQDIRNSEELIKEIKPTATSFQITTPYPGTAMYDKYIFPKPKKEEYGLFKNRYVEIERFRMAAHNLSFKKILPDLTSKYDKAQPSYFLTNRRLRKKVFRGRKIINYLREYLQYTILQKFILLKQRIIGLSNIEYKLDYEPFCSGNSSTKEIIR